MSTTTAQKDEEQPQRGKVLLEIPHQCLLFLVVEVFDKVVRPEVTAPEKHLVEHCEGCVDVELAGAEVAANVMIVLYLEPARHAQLLLLKFTRREELLR